MLGNDPEVIATIAVATILLFIFASFLVVFAQVFRQRQIRSHKEKEVLHAQYKQEILTTQLEIQNQTLQKISEELHDNVGQLLSVARINLNMLEELEHNTESLHHITQANEVIKQSIDDLRALTKSFDGDFVKDFGLIESMSHELVRIRATNRYHTELAVSGTHYSLGYEKEIVLFRIAQEILNNCLKHSRATEIRAELFYETKKFRFFIQDNGKGFHYESLINNPLNSYGAGLRNMHRRSQLIGGKMTVLSELEKGTRVEIEILPNI